MELNEQQYRGIEGLLPKQRGNVKIPNLQLLNALIYRCENGCKWRKLPKKFGDWHVIYVRLNRWAKKGVLERVYTALSEEGLISAGDYCLDSTLIKVHPNAQGAEKNGPQAIGKSRGGMEQEDPRAKIGR